MAEKRAKTVRTKKTAVKKPAARSTRAPAKKVAKTAAKKANKKVAAPSRKPKASAADSIVQVVKKALEDIKAVNVTVLDVRDLTDIADTLVIASGNSDRHVRSIADRVVEFAKKAGHRPLGVEGERDGEWVLVDLHDVIVHIMLPRVREFYRLESLWDVRSARREAAAAGE
jgi:ribosome-associated protein